MDIQGGVLQRQLSTLLSGLEGPLCGSMHLAQTDPLRTFGFPRLRQTYGSGNDGSMTKEHYPDAIPADEIVDEIGKHRAANPVFRYGYECLFIAEKSIRPSMEFSLLPADLNSPDWRSYVVQQVGRARADARVGETVYFDAD